MKVIRCIQNTSGNQKKITHKENEIIIWYIFHFSVYIVQDPDGIVTTSNLDNNESTTPDQILCSQQCEALHKIASKLHQLENGQRKIIQLLLNLDKELTSKEKSGTTHCSKHSRFIQKIYIYLFLTKRILCI